MTSTLREQIRDMLLDHTELSDLDCQMMSSLIVERVIGVVADEIKALRARSEGEVGNYAGGDPASWCVGSYDAVLAVVERLRG